LCRGKNQWQERDYILQQFHERENKSIRDYQRFMEEGKDQGQGPESVVAMAIKQIEEKN
jgi:hypothetical protein